MTHSKDYIRLILDRKILIVVFMLIVGVISFISTSLLPVKSVAESTFVVSRVNREASEDFQFDNYYAIQSAEYISNTVIGFLASPDIAETIYQKSGVEVDQDAYGKVKNIKARQKSSHLVNVKVHDSSAENAEIILKATATVLNEKISGLESTKNGENAFELSMGDVVFSSTKVNAYLALVVGLVAGLFVGIAVVFLKEYLAVDSKKKA